jgi:hypothetical protein
MDGHGAGAVARACGIRRLGSAAACILVASAAFYPRQHGSIIEGAVYDERRVQDAVLALMHHNAHRDSFGWRAWKSFPWEATDGLHERGLISDPRSKAKSVALMDEGARLAEQLFTELFGDGNPDSG